MDYQVVDSLLADHEIRFPLSELAELDRLEELVKSDELMKLAVVNAFDFLKIRINRFYCSGGTLCNVQTHAQT
jgi:hypothetical protein